MSSIEANVSTQVADVQRPANALSEDQRAQSQAAQQASASPDAVAQKPMSEDDVRAASAQMQQVVEAASGRHLSFELQGDSGSQDLVVKVMDAATDEVIKQIPGEEVLAMRERISEVVGLLFADEA